MKSKVKTENISKQKIVKIMFKDKLWKLAVERLKR